MTPPEDKAPDMPCCAHLRVTERHEENGGFVTRTWWECELCRLEFTPLPPQSPDQGAVEGFDKFVEMLDREPQYKPRLAALLKEHAAQTQDSGNEGWRPMGELPPNTMVRILSQNGNEFNGRHHVTVEKNYGYRAEGGGILDNPRGWKPLPTPAPIDAEVREALNWINCDEAVARDALEKTGSKLPQARVRIYETIRAALKKGG